MLNPDFTACLPKIENCKVNIKHQPIGLNANYETDPFSWYCSDCIDGLYLNSTDLTCDLCSEAIPNCLACESETNCTQCDFGFIANERTCDVPNLPNCMVPSVHSHMCAQCQPFFTLSADGFKCIPCSQAAHGCVACSLDSIGSPLSCYQCANNLYLGTDGQCHWDTCSVWSNLDKDFYTLPTATCKQCIPSYGVFNSTNGLNNTCVPCYENQNQNQIWANCANCNVDVTGTPTDCISCAPSYSLLQYFNGTFPAHQCNQVTLANCITINPLDGTKCKTCASGYFWSNEQENCISCGIGACNSCHEIRDQLNNYTTCDVCNTFFVKEKANITLTNNASPTIYTFDACDWDLEYRMPFCNQSDLTDDENCLQCYDQYYYNSTY